VHIATHLLPLQSNVVQMLTIAVVGHDSRVALGMMPRRSLKHWCCLEQRAGGQPHGLLVSVANDVAIIM
jgi:hypothetical protein